MSCRSKTGGRKPAGRCGPDRALDRMGRHEGRRTTGLTGLTGLEPASGIAETGLDVLSGQDRQTQALRARRLARLYPSRQWDEALDHLRTFVEG